MIIELDLIVFQLEFILEYLGSGKSLADIVKDYDDLEYKDILTVLQFAAGLSQLKSIFKIASC